MAKYGEGKNNRVTIRLTDEEKIKLDKLAIKDNRNVSEIIRNIILNEIDNMNNLEGRKWGELSSKQKSELMGKARVWENVVGECIVDFEDLDVSIAGFNKVDDVEAVIIIDDNNTFYNPKK